MGLLIENANEILREALRELQVSTNITRLTPGSKAQAIALAMNKQYRMAMHTFELGAALSFVNGATGIYLDFIGELVGVQRDRETRGFTDKASKNIKLYTLYENFGQINDGQPFTAFKGDMIYSDSDVNGNVITFYLTEDVTLSPNVNYVWVSAEAAGEGSEFNVGSGILNHHNITNYADAANNTLLVTNFGPIDNGSGVEADDHYRYRIINSRLTGEAANATAIRLAVLNTPGVADLIELEYYRGVGTADIIVESSSGYTTTDLLQAVQSRVDTLAKGFSNHILCRAPIEIGLQLYLIIDYLPNTTSVRMIEIERQYLLNFRQYLFSKKTGDGLRFNDFIGLFPIIDGVRSIGSPNKPINLAYIFKPSSVNSAGRIRSLLVSDYTARFDEKLLPEQSVESPLVIQRVT